MALLAMERILNEAASMHYLEGYKVQEIARAHGWTETAVRIRLLRARRAAGKRFAA